LQDAIASARDAGIIFVAACGNSSGNNDDPASAIFPASYDLANIIAVAATTRADGLAGFSNYGATTVDLAAPGIPVFSCWNDADDAYQYFAGTSMAAAHVSGACALTLALHPDENYQRIIERILGGVDKVPGLAGKCATGGRLNLQKALGGSPPPPKPTITVAVSEANASESGNSGAFAISRVGSNTSALTVNYVMNGTAQNGGDYENLPGSATISAGSTSATVPLRPIDDGAVEGPETVVLTLLPDAAYTVGSPDRATMTLTDNDQPPAAPVAGFTANPTSGQAPLGVQFVNESTGNVTSWDWNFGDGTAHSLVPNPYHNYSSAGTFTATLTVSGPGGSSSRNTTIQVSSPPPPEPSTLTVTAGDAVASESGDPGAFTIRRSGGTGSALLVNYTLDGTAAGGADYQDLSGSVTFPQGADSATVIVRPVDDFTDEGSETVVLALAGSPAYVVGTPASATVIITDNDQTPDTRPYVSAIAIKPDASESGAGGLITIVRTGGAATALTVSYTLGGNARNGVDYQPLSGSVTIPAGASSADVVIIPIDDQGEEIDEPVYLMLAPGAGYIVGRPNAVTVMIADNDQQPTRATVTVVATDPNASESGDSGVFTISRTGSTASALTVNYTLGGNGQNGVDYQTIGLTVTIPAGADSATVTIRPLEDAGREIDEPVYLMLAPGAGYIVGKPDAATVILADND
jgi:PKD repeat protein